MSSYRLGTTQLIGYTTLSVAVTSVFGAQTRCVRLVANSACHFEIGTSPTTATTSSPFLAANREEYVTVTPGQSIAAIRASTDGLVTATSGTLWVSEVA